MASKRANQARESAAERNRPQRLHDSTDEVNCTSSKKFIEYIGKELSDGYGFVAFIGAGMSVPSGAPLVRELHHYLHGCIYLALGVGEPGKRPWNPRTDQWPPFSLGSRYTPERCLAEIQQVFSERGWVEGRKLFQAAIGRWPTGGSR